MKQRLRFAVARKEGALALSRKSPHRAPRLRGGGETKWSHLPTGKANLKVEYCTEGHPTQGTPRSSLSLAQDARQQHVCFHATEENKKTHRGDEHQGAPRRKQHTTTHKQNTGGTTDGPNNVTYHPREESRSSRAEPRTSRSMAAASTSTHFADDAHKGAGGNAPVVRSRGRRAPDGHPVEVRLQVTRVVQIHPAAPWRGEARRSAEGAARPERPTSARVGANTTNSQTVPQSNRTTVKPYHNKTVPQTVVAMIDLNKLQVREGIWYTTHEMNPRGASLLQQKGRFTRPWNIMMMMMIFMTINTLHRRA